MPSEFTVSNSNVQQLLDSLGTPPKEVCLDWAWQLLNYSVTQLRSNSSASDGVSTGEKSSDDRQANSESSDTDPLSWSQWFMAESGELTLSPSVGSSKLALSKLPETGSDDRVRAMQIAQLLDWAGADWGDAADRLSSDVQRCVIQRLYNNIIRGGSNARGSVSLAESSSATKSDWTTEYRVSRTSSGRAPSTKINQRNKSKKKPRSSRPSRVKHFAIGLTLPAALLGLSWYLLRRVPETPPSLRSADRHSSITSESSLHSPPDATEIVLQTADLLTAGDGELDSETAEDPNLVPPSSRVSRDSVAQSLGGLLDSSASETVKESSSQEDVSQDQLLAEAVSELTQGGSPEEPLVTELAVDSEAEQTKVIPVQLISTSVMMQIQKLPERIRVKEPVWQVQLVPSEQFSIEPNAPQRLGGKAIVSWTLVPTDMSQRKSDEIVTVLVQAQLAGRKPDIRWKITASAKDIPWLVVPINPDRLVWMLATIMDLQASTTAAIELLQSTGRSGVPRSAGPTPFQQRKALEEHLKVLKSIERVVVDASLYVTSLGESIEVHGVLIDNADPEQPVTLLQLGDGIASSSTTKAD